MRFRQQQQRCAALSRADAAAVRLELNISLIALDAMNTLRDGVFVVKVDNYSVAAIQRQKSLNAEFAEQAQSS
jgi:hypothetical protein